MVQAGQGRWKFQEALGLQAAPSPDQGNLADLADPAGLAAPGSLYHLLFQGIQKGHSGHCPLSPLSQAGQLWEAKTPVLDVQTYPGPLLDPLHQILLASHSVQGNLVNPSTQVSQGHQSFLAFRGTPTYQVTPSHPSFLVFQGSRFLHQVLVALGGP